MGKMTLETQLKSQVKDYLKIKGIFCYHLLQGVGSFRGLPDMVMHYEGDVHYLELKAPKGKLSPYQVRFQEQCQWDEVSYHVIRKVEDLMEVVG